LFQTKQNEFLSGNITVNLNLKNLQTVAPSQNDFKRNLFLENRLWNFINNKQTKFTIIIFVTYSVSFDSFLVVISFLKIKSFSKHTKNNLWKNFQKWKVTTSIMNVSRSNKNFAVNKWPTVCHLAQANLTNRLLIFLRLLFCEIVVRLWRVLFCFLCT
jgi:hypothetical protein